MEHQEFDAALVISANSDDLTALRTTPTRIPTVIVNRSVPNYPCVTVDHVETGRIAALHALCKGGDSVGLVLNPASYEGMNLRANAFSAPAGSMAWTSAATSFTATTPLTRGMSWACP